MWGVEEWEGEDERGNGAWLNGGMESGGGTEIGDGVTDFGAVLAISMAATESDRDATSGVSGSDGVVLPLTWVTFLSDGGSGSRTLSMIAGLKLSVREWCPFVGVSGRGGRLS